MISENNIESNTNDENQDNDLYQKDIETNIDYDSWYKKEPSLKGKIIDLNYRIDNIDEQQKTLADHVLEFAKTLNESNLCETDKICITTKKVLKEKIRRGKISEKWIEDCLPPEYKRKYEKKKSEVSSLSTKMKKAPLVVAENSGESFMIREEENANIHPSSELTESNILNQDLENKNKGSAADKVTKSESLNNQIKEIRIAKERFNEITDALNKCISSVFIRFNAKGIIESIEPDTIREQRLENVNDISNDDYTY